MGTTRVTRFGSNLLLRSARRKSVHIGFAEGMNTFFQAEKESKMSPSDLKSILSGILETEPEPFDIPTHEDWQRLQDKFDCKFHPDFMLFMSLMSSYRFLGDILNVASGRTNGNDQISLTYDLECQEERWNPAMIPFYAIGNGDYFCLHKDECPCSKVYYYYSEVQVFEVYSESFELWVKQLPEFLQ